MAPVKNRTSYYFHHFYGSPHKIVKIVTGTIFLFPLHLFAGESCFYQTKKGVLKTVKSINQVPAAYKKQARCFAERDIREVTPKLAAPDEISLEGTIRKERIITPLGPINLRWSRSAESVLGRNPLRATTDAARMVSRALKQSGFPGSISTIKFSDANFVFMDENLPDHQVPSHLISNCHPAWMTPPSNIYVVVQRVVAGCGGSSPGKAQADSKMAEVLGHEIGHVLEAHLLQGAFGGERWRAEGFATWFEATAAEYSKLIPRGSVLRDHKRFAKSSFRSSPGKFYFQGTGQDYARASMYFHAVVKARGVKGLMRVYEALKSGEPSFFGAVKKEIGWSQSELEKRAEAFASS